MSGSYKSPNMEHADFLWWLFVACDPELSALEREKEENERRHAARQKSRHRGAKRPTA